MIAPGSNEPDAALPSLRLADAPTRQRSTFWPAPITRVRTSRSRSEIVDLVAHQGLGALVPQAQNIGRYVTNLLRRENEKRHGGMYVGGKPEVKSCRGHPGRVGDFFEARRCGEGGLGLAGANSVT